MIYEATTCFEPWDLNFSLYYDALDSFKPKNSDMNNHKPPNSQISINGNDETVRLEFDANLIKTITIMLN